MGTVSDRSGPAFPLAVAFAGGRVRHNARATGVGAFVMTLCRKRGVPLGDGEELPWCSVCRARPNPIDQRSYRSPETEPEGH